MRATFHIKHRAWIFQIRLSRMPDYPINQQAKAKLYLIRYNSNDKKVLYYPYPYPYPYPVYSFGAKKLNHRLNINKL